MTDFTPGPWEVQSSPQGRFGADWKLINGPSNSYVVSTDSYIRRQGGEDTCYHGVDISAANARLIAQAPALYEALEAASHCQYHSEQLKRQIDAVLAAARAEQ
jgi:hypothetical protein